MDQNLSAFPWTEMDQTRPGENAIYAQHSGMTLRDYFAGQVISCLIPLYGTNIETAAFRAYEIADAMLKAGE